MDENLSFMMLLTDEWSNTAMHVVEYPADEDHVNYNLHRAVWPERWKLMCWQDPNGFTRRRHA